MGVKLIVMSESFWQRVYDGFGAWLCIDTDVVALETPHERLRHALRSRALRRRSPRPQPDVAGERLRFSDRAVWTFVGEPFGGCEQAVGPPKAMLDDGHREIAHVFAPDAYGFQGRAAVVFARLGGKFAARNGVVKGCGLRSDFAFYALLADCPN